MVIVICFLFVLSGWKTKINETMKREMETKEMTYAQETIKKCISEKLSVGELFQDYSEQTISAMRSEYGDYWHSDYSDYYRVR